MKTKRTALPNARNSRAGIRIRRLVLILGMAALVALPGMVANAKSVYLIADINASPTPIETYNINQDRTVTFQATADVPALAAGAVGIALDADSETLFITYEGSNIIQLVDARTFEVLTQVTAPGAFNLAGIAFDHELQRLYTIDRNTPTMYVYDWDAATTILALVAGFPIDLPDAIFLYGIALDELNGMLYVADPGSGIEDAAVRYYDTATWTKQGEFVPSMRPIGIAVDPARGFVYTGGFFFGSDLMSKYDVDAETEVTQSVSAGLGDGIVGLAVDVATGLVYATRGYDNAGDDLTVWDTSSTPFVLIDDTDRLGDVTGIVVPFTEVSFNPLNLRKDDGLDDESGECVVSGQNVIYDVCFDNANDYDATNVVVMDTLPAEAVFVSASDGGAEVTPGQVEWAIGTLVAGTTERCLQVTMQLTGEPLSIAKNTVEIDCDQTEVTTTSDDTNVCETPPTRFVDLMVDATGEGGSGSIGIIELLALFGIGVAGLYRRTRRITILPALLAVGLVGGLLVSTAAPAQTTSQWYVGGSIDTTNGDYDAGDLTSDMTGQGYSINNVAVDHTDTGYQIFGGYHFTPNLSMEIAWVDLGQIESRFGTTVEESEVSDVVDDTARVHGYLADGFTVSGIGRYPVNPQVDLYARLGLFAWDAKATAHLFSGGTDTATVKDSGTDLTLGVGVEYEVTPTISLRGEYERFNMKRNDATTFSIGIGFGF